MKKIAAAALAATMTLSVGAVEAQAASNTISGTYFNQTCNLYFDGIGARVVDQDKAESEFSKVIKSDGVAALRLSADMGESFGSSNSERVAQANNAEALDACIRGENYRSQPLTESAKAGYIAGTVIVALLAIGGAAAPFVQPLIQKYLPF